MYSKNTLYLAALLGIVATACVIYLTPLKWLNVIQPPMNDIDPAEFRAAFLENPDQYLFFDVRNPSAYNAAHAAGSVSQPIGTLYDLHETLPRSGKTIVLICSSGRLAGVAYGYLEREGFLNLARIEGGVQAWALAGLPLEGHNLSAPIPEMD
jgi:rhodanese-related sulfurtransferase